MDQTQTSSVTRSSDEKSISRQNDPIENGLESQEKKQVVTENEAIDSIAVDESIELGEDVSQEQDPGSLERVKSKQPSVNNAAAIPDGGVMAWLQVLGAFFLFFNSWGIVNTFGSYQAYYESVLLPNSTPSAIAWIGSIQAFLLLVVGALSGPVYDRGYFRYLIISGTFMLVLGQMTLSACTEYWQVLLAQAICIGTGCGLLFIPSVGILSTYFNKKVGVAMGLAASGSSMGGVIYPIIFHKLLPLIGFGWTTRVLGFIILGTMLIPNILMRVRVLPPATRSLLDLAAFRIPAYSLMCFAFFIGFMGLYMPFFYGQVYALNKHITNPDLAFYLLAILNSTSTFGRIIPNMMSDRIGPMNAVVPCTFMSAILCFCYITVDSAAGIIVLQAFYGFFSGSFVSLPPTIIVSLSLDARDKIGTRMGQSFACVAVGLLVGTPIGGAILDTKIGFTGAWVFGGAFLLASGTLLWTARVCHKGWGFMIKA
ncbi:MFS general substrate transporter [Massarina eburnea CBS 473.64]|uniref:MFS general substrate transporter n=1 Tax=Massarina eburnea CBS 473.64 TaxID=1395130 RepID=A0A6A6SE89_9PLEO|nr:MFS general substrate transporter [Massarina eburnea CBS 473.64]